MKVVITGVDPVYPIFSAPKLDNVTGLRAKVNGRVEFGGDIPSVYVDLDFNDEDLGMYNKDSVLGDWERKFEKSLYSRIIDKAVERNIVFEVAKSLHIHVREVIADVEKGDSGAFILVPYKDTNHRVAYVDPKGLKFYSIKRPMSECIRMVRKASDGNTK